MQVELGDYVEVDTDEGLTWVVEVLEMFQTTEVCTRVSVHTATMSWFQHLRARGFPHQKTCHTFRRASQQSGAAPDRWINAVSVVMTQLESV